MEPARGTDMIQKGDTAQINLDQDHVLHRGGELPRPGLLREVRTIVKDGGLIPQAGKVPPDA